MQQLASEDKFEGVPNIISLVGKGKSINSWFYVDLNTFVTFFSGQGSSSISDGKSSKNMSSWFRIV